MLQGLYQAVALSICIVGHSIVHGVEFIASSPLANGRRCEEDILNTGPASMFGYSLALTAVQPDNTTTLVKLSALKILE
jgi:hypothetical protein